MRALLSLGIVALMSAGPAIAAVQTPDSALPSGASLATPTGTRLFPRLAGLPMPGWLIALDLPAVAPSYEGFLQQSALPDGHRLIILRTQSLMGVYLLDGERCVGHLLFEPQSLEAPDAVAPRLKRAGFQARAGILATEDRRFGADVIHFERRRGGAVEHYVVVQLPVREDGRRAVRPILGAEAYYPARLASSLSEAIRQGLLALADYCQAEETSRKSSF